MLGHCGDIDALLPALASFQPTFILAVPRVFEKVYNGAEQRAASEKKGAIFGRAARVAIAYSRALDTPGGPALAVRTQHARAGPAGLQQVAGSPGRPGGNTPSPAGPRSASGYATSSAASASPYFRGTA